MSSLAQDLRFALRVMARRPLVSFAIVGTLALGLGAVAAIYRVFSAAYLHPLPFADEERLVRVYVTPRTGGARISPRIGVFEGLREHGFSFESVVAQRFMDMALATDAGPERVTGIAVSEGWARTLGLEAQLGRVFEAREERQGLGSAVALASHSVWQARFGGARDVVGRVVRLDGRSRTIVGVMPPGLRYPYEADFWLPMAPADDPNETWGLNIQARLRPGVTLAQMREELAALTRRLPALRESDDMALLAVPLREVLVGSQGRLLAALLGAVAFLMLIVSVNVAHLLLANGLSRRREFAIRTALGAGTGRHVRQLLAEGCLLALMGGAAGMLLAQLASSAFAALLPSGLAVVFEAVPLDHRVPLLTLAVSLLAGLAFGLIPALRGARRDPREALLGGVRSTAGAGAGRFGRALIASELALALVLLSGAGVLVQDLERRQRLDLGYRPENLLTLNVSLASEPYARGEARASFLEAATERLSAVPGVAEVGTTTTFPADGQGTFLANVEAEGREPLPDQPWLVHSRLVSGAFFSSMGMRLIRGRVLDERDGRESAPVVVVSRSLAERHWPGEDPIGKRVRDGRRAEASPWLSVVGVVEDLEEFYAETREAWYLPYAQHPGDRSATQAVFVVRTALAPESVVPAARAALRELDPTLAVFDVATAESLYRRSLAAREAAGLLSALFASVGLLVAALGVYGAVAFAVGRRTREIAVRLAVGAERGRVVRGLLGQSLLPIVGGLALGVGGVAALWRWLASVADVERLDPALVAGAILVLAAVAVTACALPAWRASRLDPATALRAD